MTERKQRTCKIELFLKAVAIATRAKGMIVLLEVEEVWPTFHYVGLIISLIIAWSSASFMLLLSYSLLKYNLMHNSVSFIRVLGNFLELPEKL